MRVFILVKLVLSHFMNMLSQLSSEVGGACIWCVPKYTPTLCELSMKALETHLRFDSYCRWRMRPAKAETKEPSQ